MSHQRRPVGTRVALIGHRPRGHHKEQHLKLVRDRVAAITGAASGIGRATAILLAQRGCHVALADLDEGGLAETVQQCRNHGVTVSSRKVDVADRAQVHAWADAVVESHGRVNVILNNAGVALGSTVENTSYTDLEWLMGINFWGVVHGTKAFLPHIKRAGEGSVVNVSSIFGLIAMPTQSAYNASKFAVRGFTESLREELEIEGSPIGALCVHPGGIKTNIARSARMVQSKGMVDAESAVKFEKSFITTPERAARAIVGAILTNRRRLLIGPDAFAVDWLQRAFPTSYQRLVVAGGRWRSRSME